MKFPLFDNMEDMLAYYYGSPGSLIRKAGVETVSTFTVGQGTHWEPIYGKKAWSWLNMEANPFAILPKEPWQKTGWRVLTTKATSAGGGQQETSGTGSVVPTPALLTFDEVYATPKLVAHSLEVSEQMELLSNIDDAVPLLAFYREQIALEHTYRLAEQLCVDVDTPALYNFESIDRVISSQSEWLTGKTASTYDANDCDIYNLDRDGTTVNDSYVNHNSDTMRDLTLTLIDTTQENILINGGQPKVILTRHNTKNRWQQLLEAERRFMQAARVIPTFGGVRSVMGAGVEAGFMVATYQGVPILESQHVIVNNTGDLGMMYFIDTDFLKIAVAKPTTYIESGFDKGMVDRSVFTAKGVYETIGELRAYSFKAHGKLRDLK